MAAASLESIIVLYQVLMALSLTNGAYIFMTGGTGQYALRPWSSFTLFGTLAFLAFVVTLVLFTHTNILILRQSYTSGFDGMGLQPIIDFALLFIVAGVFYMLSHTLTRIDQDFLSYFYVLGALFAIDIFWALVTFAFDRSRRMVLVYALLNSAAPALGALFIAYHVVYLRELLLATLVARTLVDYVLTYDYLFPGAFTGLRPLSVRNAALIVATIAIIAIGFADILPYTNPSQAVIAWRPVALIIGCVFTAAAWLMASTDLAGVQQWIWFGLVFVYTPALLLLGGLSYSLASPLSIASPALLLLAPLMVIVSGIVGAARSISKREDLEPAPAARK